MFSVILLGTMYKKAVVTYFKLVAFAWRDWEVQRKSQVMAFRIVMSCPEDGGIIVLRNDGNLAHHHTASHPNDRDLNIYCYENLKSGTMAVSQHSGLHPLRLFNPGFPKHAGGALTTALRCYVACKGKQA